MNGKRDLHALKARLLQKIQQPTMAPLLERLRNQAWTDEERRAKPSDITRDMDQYGWVVDYRMTKHLKDVIRNIYQGSIDTEDAREFTMWIHEHLKGELESWGEEPMSAQEYMAAQEAAAERAKDTAEFERLKRKLGK